MSRFPVEFSQKKIHRIDFLADFFGRKQFQILVRLRVVSQLKPRAVRPFEIRVSLLIDEDSVDENRRGSGAIGIFSLKYSKTSKVLFSV